MSHDYIHFGRRVFLSTFALGAATFTTRGLFANELAMTPWLTEGPFYPDKLPLDTDNDLIVLGDSLTPAVGQVAHLTGKILDAHGNPLRNALVEIWQVDGNGAYLHSRDQNASHRDKNFQGYGRFETASTGEYRFRTVKPVAYPGRTPHIHVKVHHQGKEVLTTQLFVLGDPHNERDGIWRSLNDQGRQLVTIPFKPVPKSRVGELMASADIVIGQTPPDREPGGGPPRGRRGDGPPGPDGNRPPRRRPPQ